LGQAKNGTKSSAQKGGKGQQMKKKEIQTPKKTNITESYISMGLGLLVVIIAGIILFNFVTKRDQKLTLPGIQTTSEEQAAQNQNTAPSETMSGKHKVAEGETLWAIAEKYYGSGYNWVTIAKANNLSNANYVTKDQELTLPQAEKIMPPGQGTAQAGTPSVKAETYTVAKGDSLWSIAMSMYNDGYAWTKIAQANNLANPNLIHVGNVLSIPR